MRAVQPPTSGPPIAPTTPYEHTEHGVVRPDPYHWLREVSSPAVLEHLRAERDWYETATTHLGSLITTLHSEMTSRVPPTTQSVPWRHRDCSYYTRHAAGSDYAQLFRDCRTSDPTAKHESVAGTSSGDGMSGPHSDGEELLLDEDELLDESGYLELGTVLVSPDGQTLAYSVDRTGDEVYALRFRDLRTGEDLPEEIGRTYYTGAWAADGQTFLYTVHDEAYRPFQVWRHRLGTPVSQDVLVRAEADERFELLVRTSRSGELLVLWARSRDTTEAWVLDATTPEGTPRSVGGRRQSIEYHLDHVRDPDGPGHLVLATNDDAVEFKVMTAPVPTEADQDHSGWRDLVAERPDRRIERVDAFAGHLVLSVRHAMAHEVEVFDVDGERVGEPRSLVSRFEAGTVELGTNTDYDATAVVVCEQSLVHPGVWSYLDLATGTTREAMVEEAPGHDADRYACEVHHATATDGTSIPLTVVRHRDTPLDGSAPALLYGYGAYEAVFELEWDPALPSLLDRGVVYAFAHVRGGGEGGRSWWLEGSMRHKQNTFGDHLAAAQTLAGLCDGDRIVTRGLSAGGLLQGAVFSQAPQRWCGVVAEVPFVDVVSSMFDASIPLTVGEWEEWGDPRMREQFDWMLAYSPYDNLPAAGGRPDLMVTGALHDPRVMVWEPAKWVAALRAGDPDWSPRCVFRVETGAGSHGGPSGRFGHLHYEAEVYAWVLDRLLSAKEATADS